MYCSKITKSTLAALGIILASTGSAAVQAQSTPGPTALPAPETLPPVRRDQGSVIGGAMPQSGQAVAVTASGAVWLAGGSGGLVRGKVDHTSILLARVNAAGTTLEHVSSHGGAGVFRVRAAQVDGSGKLWICGETSSRSLPQRENGWNPIYQGQLRTGFISRHGPDGQMEWSSYVGGTGRASCAALAVNSDGSGYLAGDTTATTIPGTAATRAPGNSSAGFVLAWSAEGSVSWGSFVDGSGKDTITSMALAGSGLWLGGVTASTDLPASTNAWQRAHGGGGDDAFIAKMSTAGTLEHLSYMGGSGREEALHLSSDGEGLWFAGTSSSPAFLGAVKADVDVYTGQWQGTTPTWHKVYGGSGRDRVFSISIGDGKDLWLSGMSTSLDFPVSADAAQPSRSVKRDAFVMRLSSADGSTEHSSYLGGADADEAYAVKASGSTAWVSGMTFSADFPGSGLRLPLGDGDAFIQRYDQSNRAPRITSAPQETATVGESYSYTAQAEDDDGDAVAWRLVTGPTGMSISGSELTWATPVLGEHPVELEARDSRGASATQSYVLRVMAANTNPRITSTAPTTATVDMEYSYRLQAVDDDGDSLSYALQSAPLGMAVEADIITWEPAAPGDYDATVTVSDGRGGSASQDFSVTVSYADGSTPPTLTAVGNHTVELGTQLKLQLTATDADGDALSYSARPLPLPQGATLSATTGEFVFKPQVHGTHTLEFSASDGRFSASSTGVFTVPEPAEDAQSRFTGRVLDAQSLFAGEEVALVGVRVSLHGTSFTTTTDSEGRFTLSGYTGGRHVLDLNSASATSSLAGVSYAGFREKITLRHGVYEREERAFTLPRLAASGATGRVTINPNGETVLKEESMGIELRIPQGVARNEDGTPYTGELYVSEVPRDLAPAALPAFMDPSLLITIQPVGVVFSQPVPITFPNTDDLPPGYEADIWSLDPVTGAFAVVGKARVTTDGESLETIEGGIRRADWHSPTPNTPIPSPPMGCNNDKECECKERPGSPECDPPECKKNPNAEGCPPKCKEGDKDCQCRMNPGGPGCQEMCEPGDKACQCRNNPSAQGCTPERPTDPEGNPTGGGGDGMPREFNRLNTDTKAKPGNTFPGYKSGKNEGKDKSKPSMNLPMADAPSMESRDSCRCGSKCGRCRGRSGGSTVNMDSGTMNQRVSLPGYQSLGESRSIGLVYRSSRANPGRVMEMNVRVRGRPSDVSYRMDSVAGVSGLGQKEMYLDTSGFGNLFRSTSDFRVALPFDASSMSTGVYKYRIRVTNHYALRSARLTGLGAVPGNVPANARTSSLPERRRTDGSRMSWFEESRTIVENGMLSPIGAGWELAGVYRAVPDSDGNVLVVSPDVGTGYFRRKSNGAFYSPDPSFSVLAEELSDGAVTGYLHWDKHGTVMHFTASGLMDYVLDRKGNRTMYEYSSSTVSGVSRPILVKITDPVGKETHLRYRNGYLSEVEDPAGRVSRFFHNSRGDLVKLVYPDGSEKSYAYEDHRMVMFMDERSNRTRYEYSQHGQLVKITLPDDAQRGVTPRSMAGLMPDDEGSRDEPGTPTHFSRVKGQFNDARGFAKAEELDPNSLPLSVLDAEGRETLYLRNRKGSILAMARPNGSVARFFYDEFGNVIKKEEKFNGAVTTYRYDQHSRLVETVNPRGNATRHELDGDGNTVKTTNALDHVTTMQYDSRGLMTRSESPNGLVTTYSYDAAGLMETMTQTPPQGSPGSARVTTYTYHPTGLMATSTSPEGVKTTYSYDNRNRLVSTANNLGESSRTSYDEHGNVTSREVVSSDGSVASRSVSEYDSRNRRTMHAVPHDANTMSTSRYLYDEESNLMATTDPAGNVDTTSYDGIGRRSGSSHRLEGKSSYEYDKLNRLVKVTAPTGIVTSYEYDDLGRKVAEHSPDRGTTTYSYDLADNVVRMVTARGITETYAYDALERKVSVKYTNGSSGKNENITYTYDNCAFGKGRLCKVEDESGTTEYSYDAFGNITSQTHTELGVAYTTSYTWDKEDRISSLTLPSGRVINYSRDSVRRLQAIEATVNGTKRTIVSGMRYRGDNLMLGCTYGNGLTDSRSYDLQGRLTSQTLSGTNGAMDQRSYSYDLKSNITSISVNGNARSYSYDALDRLITENSGQDTSVSYSLDLNHNRQTKVQSLGARESYAYDEGSNKLRQMDRAGQSLPAQGPDASYEYNDAGRLWRYLEGGRLVAEYIYNAEGQRTRKVLYDAEGVTPTKITVYHWSMGMLVEETTGTGTLIRSYITGTGHMPVAQVDAQHTAQGETTETVSYLYSDHLQTPRLATSATGSVTWRWDGDGFGDATPTGTAKINIRFPGQYHDAESGLYYNHHRYYDPATGRYLRNDPIGLEDGTNTYLYANSNPIIGTDPSGLLSYNAPSPQTEKVDKHLEQKVLCIEDCMSMELVITGGSEKYCKRKNKNNDKANGKANGEEYYMCHGPNSKHYEHKAVDFGFLSNDGLKERETEFYCCAKKCGFKYGKTSHNHFHIQTVPGIGGATGEIR